MTQAISLDNVQFGWSAATPLINIPHFSLKKSDQLLIFGPSGCGKSSLLNLITGVNRVNQGSISIFGHDITRFSSSKLDKFRAQHFGIIFQTFNLIPYFNLIDNIQLRCRLAGKKLEPHALNLLLDSLQLEAHSHKPCAQLSLGQQQRVAIARALITQPEIVIADEPTSSLDPDNKHSFIKLLLDECSRRGTSVIMVSHDRELHQYFANTVEFSRINSL
jgi:putative ABC transport system ATP-binding protein